MEGKHGIENPEENAIWIQNDEQNLTLRGETETLHNVQESSIGNRDSVGDTNINESLSSPSYDSSDYMDPDETHVDTSTDSITSTDISTGELQSLGVGEAVLRRSTFQKR
ncbi:unnamed protein product [Arctia plantaginis]|uniref:Uncharacterized protein n=1 Tax=Arctia plantaginis TaxID=874455 RepID=A0A8S0YYZ9_ARCPL|nr:unnamed protein product [Arctia plantaginis]